jgi:hypothetical protein
MRSFNTGCIKQEWKGVLELGVRLRVFPKCIPCDLLPYWPECSFIADVILIAGQLTFINLFISLSM